MFQLYIGDNAYLNLKGRYYTAVRKLEYMQFIVEISLNVHYVASTFMQHNSIVPHAVHFLL